MRIAFATCVELGLNCIEKIYQIGGHLDLLVTLHDGIARDKSGRVFLDSTAMRHSVPVLKVRDINEGIVISTLRELSIDWLLIIGWSQIAKSDLLCAPTLGCIGMHPSLLPTGRGRAAIPWAILKGLDQTGVTMFKLDTGVDTGDIIGQQVIPIGSATTATELYAQVGRAHAELLAQYWPGITANSLKLSKQDDAKATVWPERRPDDGELRSSMTMAEADRLVRAVTRPYPGAFYRTGAMTMRIWSATVDQYSGNIRLVDGYLTPVEFEIVSSMSLS